MSLKILLLGLIEISPMPGYNLMKAFDDSMLFYWHATHTQIYNTLKEMEKDGLVTSEVVHQVVNPSKKVFSITEKGKEALTEWLLEEAELPGFKHDFLIKLSLSSRLSERDLLLQLNLYEQKLKDKLTALKSEKKKEFLKFARSNKELILWEMTFENGIMYYQNELAWVEKVKKGISQ